MGAQVNIGAGNPFAGQEGGGPLSVQGVREKYIARAIAALGTPNLTPFFDDFITSSNGTVPGGWFAFPTGSGANSILDATSAQTTSGLMGSNTGVSAGSKGQCLGNAQVARIQSGVSWYMATRQRFTAPAAQSSGGMCLFDSSAQTITLGMSGPLNAVNFGAQYNGASPAAGAFLDSGVPWDAGYHTWEVWGVGSALALRFEDGPVFTGALALGGFTGYQQIIQEILNGADVVDRGTFADWVLFASAVNR